MLFRLSAIGIAAGVLVAPVIAAGPAGAVANDAPAVPTTAASAAPMLMPEVRGLILQRAVRTVRAITGEADLDLRFVNRKDAREVINQQNWEVCAQAPAPGRAISEQTLRVTLYVKRPGTRGCS